MINDTRSPLKLSFQRLELWWVLHASHFSHPPLPRSNVADAKIFFSPCHLISNYFSGSGVTEKACVPPSGSSFPLCLLPVQIGRQGSLHGKIWLVIWGEDAVILLYQHLLLWLLMVLTSSFMCELNDKLTVLEGLMGVTHLHPFLLGNEGRVAAF